MKKVLSVLLALMLFMSSFSALADQANFEAQAGETIKVTFNFTSPGVCALKANISYPDELECVGYTSSVWGVQTDTSWQIVSVAPVTSGFCTYTFKVADGAADGVYKITLDVVKTGDASYQPVEVTIDNPVVKVTVGEHAHTEETIPAVDPTCTEVGLTAGTFCPDCGTVLVPQEEIPALGHTEVIDAAVPADCTETGLTEGSHCSVCGEVIVAQEVVDALGHTEVVDAAVPADCTETGLTEGSHCSVCGEVIVAQEVVDALGHTEEIIPAVDATCTETGLTEGKKCSVCDEIIVAQEEVAALGHTEETVEAVAPTCTATGLTAGTFCSVCDTVLVAQEEVAALGHTEVIDEAVAATCTETGLTEGKHCSVCGEIIVAQEEVAALGHTEEIIPAVEPTFTETGLTEGKKCSVCGEIIVAQEEIPMLVPAEVPQYTVEKVSDTRGKVTYIENENSMPLEEVMVRITWRYTLSNGDTISVTLVRNVREDGTFKTTGVTVPSDSVLNYVYVEVVDDADADEKDRGAYDVFGKGQM